MNILVTGSEGYLGSYLVNYFRKKKYNIYGVDLYQNSNAVYNYYNFDISVERNYQALKKIKFDLVIHAAAKLPIEKDNKKMNDVNIEGTKHLINFLEKFNSNCKLIFISTNAMYSSNYDYKVKESTDKTIIDNYGRTKLIAENMIIKSSLNYSILRSPIIISKYRAGVISIAYDLIGQDKKIPLLNRGINTFDAIEINDLSDAIYLLFKKDVRNIYNVSCDQVLSFRDIFQYIIVKSSSKSTFINLPRIKLAFVFKLLFFLRLSPIGPYHLAGLVSNFKFDNSKLKKMGWVPKNNIKETFYESYKYYISNEFSQRSTSSKSQKKGIIKLLNYFL